MNTRKQYDVKWHSKDLGYGLKVAVGDINGDGRQEIVAGTTYPGFGPTFVYIIRWNGKTFKTIETISLGSKQDVNALAVGDIDGDGKDEVIVGANNRIYVFEIRRGGYKRVYLDETLRGKVDSLAVGDIDGDGRDEIAASTKNSSRLNIIDYKRGNYNRLSQTFSSNIINVAIGNVDSGRRNEVVLLTGQRRSSLLSVMEYKNNNLTTKYSKKVPSSPGRILEVGDVNEDHRGEILFDIGNNKVYLAAVYNNTINQKWISPVLDDIPTAAVISDIDNDGTKEITIATLESTYIYSFRGNRAVLEWRQDLPNGIISMDTGDLDANNKNELVLGTQYGYIYVLQALRNHRGDLWIGRVQTIFKEKATLPEGKPDIQKVVDDEVKVRLTDTVVLEDKVIVEGEIEARILYAADLPTQPVHFFHQTFPFLQFVNLYGAEPGMEAAVHFDVEYTDIDVIDPRTVETTVLVKTVVKLMSPWWHD